MTKPIKNYLVSNLFKLKTQKWAWTDRTNEGDIYAMYRRMYEISLASYKHFLVGDWEHILWEGEVEHSCNVAKAGWPLQYDLWHKEPCNIIFHGPDTLMIKPTEIFGVFDKFEMFNYTDPRSLQYPNPYGWNLPHYLNDDFRYMPHTMDESVWEVGQEMSKNWNTDNTDLGWNYGQVLHNQMYWSQGRTIEETHRPYVFYQAWMINSDPASLEYANNWNGCDINDAHVLHLSGSRGAQARVEWMESLARQVGVPI